MRRREVVALLCGSAAFGFSAARAEAALVIGYLSSKGDRLIRNRLPTCPADEVIE